MIHSPYKIRIERRDFYCACPSCDKNSFVTNDSGFSCPHCAIAIDFESVVKAGRLLDIYQANQYFASGQAYFFENDYKEANQYFGLALKNDPNHYLAAWYQGIGTIYIEGSFDNFGIAVPVKDSLISAVDKLNKSFAKDSDKLEFCKFAYSQAVALLSGYFDRAVNRYEQEKKYPELMSCAYEFCSAAATLIRLAVDLNILDTIEGNESLTKNIQELLNLFSVATYFAVKPYRVGKKLFLPKDKDLSYIKDGNNLLGTIASKYQLQYSTSSRVIDFSDALTHAEETFVSLQSYYRGNPEYRKTRLSVIGKTLDNVLSACLTDMQHIYFTLQSDLSESTGEIHIKLASLGARFCIECLMPRVVQEDKKFFVVLREPPVCKLAVRFLVYFVDLITKINPKIANTYYKLFFEDVLSTLAKCFGPIYSRYSKYSDKLKDAQDSPGFVYYYNFLYSIVTCCSYALPGIGLGDEGIGTKQRRAIQRIGKLASAEFMFLFDHDIAKITASDKFGDMVRLFYKFDEL